MARFGKIEELFETLPYLFFKKMKNYGVLILNSEFGIKKKKKNERKI
jgi:hypothetical protein